MEYPLERLLIYTDKKRIDEFEIPNAEYDELYELYITTKDDVLADRHKSIDFFNEVFYYLTCIYANAEAAENLNSYLYNGNSLYPALVEPGKLLTKQEVQQVKENNEMAQEASYYIMGFVWLILKKQKELPKHVRFFLLALEYALRDVYHGFDIFLKFLSSHSAKYSISIEIKPEFDFEISLCTTQEWQEATEDFDQIVVECIIRRFRSPVARQSVAEVICQTLAETNADPNFSHKLSSVTHRAKANEQFISELLKQLDEDDERAEEVEQIIEKSKTDRIKELEKQIEELEVEKQKAIHNKEAAERERDNWRKKWEELNTRLNKKYIPAEFKTDEAKLIIDELIKQDIITPIGQHSGTDFVLHSYRWDGTGALFGYFVDKMNFQLELADSGGRIDWKPFKHAFSNYEDKVKRARDTISQYRKHSEAKMPEKAEKIDEAIAESEKKLAKK